MSDTTPDTANSADELKYITDSKDWEYACTAYGEGQFCCCESQHPNYKRLMDWHNRQTEALLRRLLEQQTVLHKDEIGYPVVMGLPASVIQAELDKLTRG